MNKSLLIYPFILFLSSCSLNEEQQTTQEPDKQPVEEVVIDEPPLPEVVVDVKSRVHRHVTPQKQPEVLIYKDTRPINETQAVLNHKQRFTGALQAHNSIRLKHGLKPLRWSNKLAKYSQEWANHLGRGQRCQIKHRTGTPPYGENLYRSSSLQWATGRTEIVAINIKEVVKSWTDEERWFNYKQNRCQPGKQCGHYTQIVWKNTTEVGCAMKICADKSQTWVCSYNPAGNYAGIRPY